MKQGVTVGLATDGLRSNNNLDFLEEMEVAALLCAYETKNPGKLSVPATIWVATKAGYEITGFPGGEIREEAPANFILIDFRKPHLTPYHHT